MTSDDTTIYLCQKKYQGDAAFAPTDVIITLDICISA